MKRNDLYFEIRQKKHEFYGYGVAVIGSHEGVIKPPHKMVFFINTRFYWIKFGLVKSHQIKEERILSFDEC